MSYVFPSQEWVAAYKDTINANPDYKVTGATWDKGVVALVCKALPEIGIKEDMGIWLDLHKGVCREASLVSAAEAMKAPFCITGEYARWKQVMKKELDPIKGMMQGKLRLKGDLPTIVRYVDASKTLVECAGMVATKFPDE
ncbi:MAG: SCP2 sterol-binding domain-containing protein [Deltaproteobacteria bacterium]|nr:SCP2 sterol-binding domain-containing protein [Deltaproteobacteria bacterium]